MVSRVQKIQWKSTLVKQFRFRREFIKPDWLIQLTMKKTTTLPVCGLPWHKACFWMWAENTGKILGPDKQSYSLSSSFSSCSLWRKHISWQQEHRRRESGLTTGGRGRKTATNSDDVCESDCKQQCDRDETKRDSGDKPVAPTLLPCSGLTLFPLCFLQHQTACSCSNQWPAAAHTTNPTNTCYFIRCSLG